MNTSIAFLTQCVGLFGTAKLAFVESEHPRGEGGEFGASGKTDAANAHTSSGLAAGGAEYHKKGAELHKAAAEAHRGEA